ncbi:PAS domain-containing protein [Flavobacterium sp. D33]|nr:PAS domain-containing protein [Flavobacterium selenitireducens]
MAPIYDNDVLTGYVKIARDMTQQKQAEEALAISEERNRVALQSANMGAWDWNIVDDVVQWNDQHFQLVGLSPGNQSLDSAFFAKFVHPEDMEMVMGELAKAVVGGLFQMDAFRIVQADATIRWMSGYGRVVESVDGVAKRMVGVMYDITDRIAAEKGLRDKQIQLEISQRAARVGVWGFDLVNMKGIATPELLELTGYLDPGDEWRLDIFLEMVHADDRQYVHRAVRKAAADHSGIELEFRMEHPEKGIQWMLMRGQFIPPYDTVNASLMGSLIDITDRRIFEEQKDAFIGIASHELRTPITSIKAYAEILEEMFAEAGDLNSSGLMHKLDGQVDRLTELIHALLDTTSIVNGKMKLFPTKFDVNQLIYEVADSMSAASSHQFEIQVSDEAFVFADRARIRQVLTNLIGNAVKYSPKSDKVIIDAVTKDNQVIVCVKDFGIGIDEEIQSMIFDRFYRSSDAQASTFSGLGLGLFISSSIVLNHEGTMSVTSVKGEGSTFCFTLPQLT